MIKYTIHEVIDWVPSFSLLEILIQKESFFCFILVLKVSLRLALNKKRGLYPLRILLLIRALFMPLQGIAPESSWLGDELTGMVKIKHKHFIGAVPIMPCLKSS